MAFKTTFTGPNERPRAAPTACAAVTLIELLIAVGVGSLVLAGLASLSIFAATSFVALGNYDALDRASRNALDTLSTEIRQTQRLASFATNRLVFVDFDGRTNLMYYWNPATRLLTRTKANQTSTLLTECDFLEFHVSQRNVSNDFIFYPADPKMIRTAKLVDVSWRCSRKILGKKMNTESVQTAKTVIRN